MAALRELSVSSSYLQGGVYGRPGSSMRRRRERGVLNTAGLKNKHVASLGCIGRKIQM